MEMIVIQHSSRKGVVKRFFRNVTVEDKDGKPQITANRAPSIMTGMFQDIKTEWCSKHTYYTAARKPTASCWACRSLYERRMALMNEGTAIGKGKL